MTSSTPRWTVLWVIGALQGGGMERVFLTLLRAIDRSRFVPQLVLFSREGPFVNDIPPDVSVRELGKRHPWDFFKLVAQLAFMLRRIRPHTVLSFEHYGNCVTLLAARLAGQRNVCVSERVELSRWFPELKYPGIRTRLVQRLYPTAYRVIAVSEAVQQDLVQRFSVPAELVTVIPNPVDVQRIVALAELPVEHPWLREDIPIIAAAGRLTHQKDYPTLLQAFALVRQHHPVRLAILGEGPQRQSLEQLAETLGVTAYVAFLGFDPNPYRYMRRASVFVLSSLYEGLPNVLLEAMALGVPVISTHYNAPAPHELITDGENGMVVPCGDSAKLAAALERVLTDQTFRGHLIRKSHERIQHFGLERMVAAYESLLAAAALARSP